MLLSCLQRKMQLTFLSLRHLQAAAVPAASLTTLLAVGSGLQHLDLSFARLPAGRGAWHRAFNRPPLHGGDDLTLSNLSLVDTQRLPQLPLLHTLKLQMAAPKLDSYDLRCLISCCPNLAELDLEDAVKPGVRLSGLRQLSGGLTRLHVDVVSPPGEVQAADLVRLTGLKHLQMLDDKKVDDGCGPAAADSAAAVDVSAAWLPPCLRCAVHQLNESGACVCVGGGCLK